jgi:hypothetical protein
MGLVTAPQTFLADLLARLSGPGVFRFVLQPLVAALLGIRDGLADARAGRAPYLWSILFDARERRATLRDGAGAIVKPFVVAIGIDAVLSYLTQGAIYPGETLVVGIGLVALPYTLARALTNRLVRRWCVSRRPPVVGTDEAVAR